ncbi:MAG: membrane-associated protease RseP (regulator of RpoE activity), partial [Candidatus Nanohaloarchaea archaeon]
VFTGLISVFAALAMLLYTFYDMIARQSAQNGPSLILPGTVSETTFQAGVSFVPAEYWVISIIIMMTVHELSHGIVARAEDIELRSVGWVIVGILPLGAFVEPEGEKMLPGDEDGEQEDESQATWDVGNWKSRLKVLCAGSFANYITAALFILMATGLTAALTSPTLFYNAQEGYPAQEAGMDNGTIIAVNGERVESFDQLRNITERVQVGDEVTLWTSEGNFTVTATDREGDEGGYIGILMGQQNTVKDQYSDYQDGLSWFISLLTTVAFLNFLIGLFNMAPIKPLDGGLVFETFTSEFVGEDGIVNVNRFSLAMWALLLLSLLLGVSASFL